MIALYQSKVDGKNRGIRRSDFDSESWDRAMRTVAGLDTAVWMFDSEDDADRFDPGLIALYKRKDQKKTP